MPGHPIIFALMLFNGGIEPQQALTDYERACRDTTLWGRALCGPMMVIDTQQSLVWANESGGSPDMIWDGVVFAGPLAAGVATANTSFHWSGLHWAGVVMPLPDDPDRTRRLLLHEAWHREQDALGYPAVRADNRHLDEFDGRVWLRLEMRALAAALDAMRSEAEAASESGTGELADHLAAAAQFRSRRYQQTPSARAGETALEMNEGLAEYTGIRLGESDPALAAANQLRSFDQHPALVRSFAYATGPGWGLLLDRCRPAWRQDLPAERNFLDLVASCVQGEWWPDRSAALLRSHGHDQIVAEERARQRARTDALTLLLQRLQAPASIELSLDGASYEFDPNEVYSAGAAGSIFKGIFVRAPWGELEASTEVLINPDYSALRISRMRTMDRHVARGDGWELRLQQPCRFAAASDQVAIECGERAAD